MHVCWRIIYEQHSRLSLWQCQCNIIQFAHVGGMIVKTMPNYCWKHSVSFQADVEAQSTVKPGRQAPNIFCVYTVR